MLISGWLLVGALPMSGQALVGGRVLNAGAHAVSYGFGHTNRQESWEGGFACCTQWGNNPNQGGAVASGSVLALNVGSTADASGVASGAHTERLFTGRGVVSCHELDPFDYLGAEASAAATSEVQFVFDLPFPGAYFTLRVADTRATGNDRSYATAGVSLVANPLFGIGSPFVLTGNTSGFLSYAYRYTLKGTASVSGEIAVASYYFSLVVDETGSPGNTAAAPVPPDNVENTEAGVVYVFANVPRGMWYDPPTTDAFRYTMRSNSLFTAILGFPTNFSGPFTVSVSNAFVGTFHVGETVSFTNYPGGGVGEFTVSGINPAANADLGFPIQLDFNTETADFTVAPQVARPVAQPQILTTWEDTPLPITLTGTNADGWVSDFAIVTPPTNGVLAGTLTNLVYVPTNGLQGHDRFTFKARDSFSESEPAAVSISVLAAVSEPPRLDAARLTPDGTFRFTLTGAAGRYYQIQVSSNLYDWEPLLPLQATNGTAIFDEPVLRNAVNRFYRAWLLP